ncbi:MAG: hypothetical protein A2Z12_04940 [Actinobacteria bacterium RBG_16_68_21]|nr:MAG: hypothetical protein A2Z12_04940 [Actinobacteria bacterium RBG_16_68_21]
MDDAGMSRLRLRATQVLLVFAPVAAAMIGLIALLSGDHRLLAWSVLGLGVSAVASLQIALHAPDPMLLIVLIAGAVALGSGIAPSSSLPGVIAAAATMSIVWIALAEGPRRGAAVALVVFALLGVALGRDSVDAGRVGGLIALAAAGAGSWALMRTVVLRMHADQASLRNLFERVPVGLYRTAVSGELLEINPAGAALLGESRNAVIGRRVRAFFVDQGDFTRLRAAVGDGAQPVVTDIRFRRADGEVIWVRDVTRPVTDESGEIKWFEGELQDVTEQRRHLEELQSLVQSKSDLIAAVSHELRTPLTAVVGFLDVLVGQEDPAAGTSELLQIACDQAHDLAGIVDDLLTAVRVENHELAVREKVVDVGDVIRRVVASISPGSRGDIAAVVSAATTAIADPARVRQILRNLIGNARRYGKPPIRVECAASAETVTIVVSDAGDVIAPSATNQMWEPFYSGGSDTATTAGGIGLGLTVSRQLAQLMSGDLVHRRSLGRNEFVLTLPAGRHLLKSA